jgi:hypothetical protein
MLMPGFVARWRREPLVHFAVLGVAVLLLHRWVAPPDARRIELTAPMVRALRQEYLRRNGSPPNAAEEAEMIDRFVDDEVLYREALALGLDRGDIIVRRRLVQKMEFLTEGLDPVPEPSDAELQAYLDAHAARWAEPERVTMTHVFVATDRHPDAAPALAAALRTRLAAGEDPAGLGDPFLRGREFPDRSRPELAAVFGPELATAVMALPPGEWSQPLRSSYGLHLVRVAGHAPRRAARLADVRAQVAHEWTVERRAAINAAALADIRRRYTIRVDAGEPATEVAAR